MNTSRRPSVAHHQLVHGHRIEQFVGDDDPFELVGQFVAVDRLSAPRGQNRVLRVPRGRAALDEVEMCVGAHAWRELPEAAQHGVRKAAVAGAGFDERERRADGTEPFGHLGELQGEQFAKERTEVDAGDEIARASRTSGGARVVAELGMVEREVHERGHSDGAALMDARANQVGDRQQTYSFRTVRNTSPSPRHTRMRAIRPDAIFWSSRPASAAEVTAVSVDREDHVAAAQDAC